MPVLWNKEIENIKKSGYFDKNITVTDALIENFYNEIMKNEEIALIDLLLSNTPTQEKLDELLKTWDIEVKQSSKSLLLAYLLKTHPELKATEYEEPRLKGLLLNQRFKNLQLIAHFTKIGKEFNKNNITPLIFKGGLMKFLNPDFPRIMGDIDVLVPDNQWIKSAKIAKSMGYWYKKLDVHSFDIMENKDAKYGILDIHKFVHFYTKNEKKWLKGLYKRATEQNIYGVKSLVPCYEDLMFLVLLNLSNNLRDNKSHANLLYAIFDCKFLLENKPDFDWDIVINNAKISGCEVHLNFATKFINKISKNILPEEIQNNFLFEKETEEYSKTIMFKNFYYVDLQNKCRAMKIGDAIKNKHLGEYINLKIKYKFLKNFYKHPILIDLFIKDLIKMYKYNVKD